jgi:hypothetical protein
MDVSQWMGILRSDYAQAWAPQQGSYAGIVEGPYLYRWIKLYIIVV